MNINELKKVKKTKDFIRLIEKLGYSFSRKKSSHEIYTIENGRCLVIPNHGTNKNLSTGTLRQLIRIVEQNYQGN